MYTSNLPAQATPFIGRLDELHQIIALLDDPTCRLLTLVGPGGIGKTRLAIEATARLDSVTDGRFIIQLQPINAVENIATAIAAALNLQLQSDTESKQQIFRFLRDKRWLLLLDNFEHLLDASTLVVEILEAAPKVKILITSREVLNLREEWVRALSGLDFPQSEPELPLENYGAVRLFAGCVRRVRGDFNLNEEAAYVLDICRLVDGVPLALELAAARLQIFPCAFVAAEIKRSLEFLTTSRRNIPERHRSMRAVFEWSWGLLSVEEQSAFAALSVFQGGFTTEAAAQIAGANAGMLASLADKSLLQVNSFGRFNLHELIRQYTAEKLNETPEIRESVLDRRCDYYTSFLHQQETTIHLHSRINILRDFDNIRAAWHYAVQRRKLIALRQASASVFWLCYLESWFEEGASLFRVAEKLFTDANIVNDDDRFLRGMALMNLGFFQRYIPQEAAQAYANIEAGRAAWRGLAPRPEMGVPLFHAALALWNMYVDPASIIEIAQECLELFQRYDEAWGMAHAMTLLGCVRGYFQGQFSEAREYIEAALVICQRENFHIGTGWCFQVQAEFAYRQGQFARSQQLFEAAIQAHGAANLQVYLSEHFCLAAEVALAIDDPNAVQLFNQAIALARELDQMNFIADGLAGLGTVHALKGESQQAQAYYEESRTIFQLMPTESQLTSVAVIGVLALMLEHFEDVRSLFDAVLQRTRGRYRLIDMTAYCLRGHAQFGLGHEREAEEDFLIAITEAAAMNTLPFLLDSLIGFAGLSSVSPSVGVELLAMAMHHPAATRISKWRAKQMLTQFMATLPEPVYTAAIERGQNLTLDYAVKLATEQHSESSDDQLTANHRLTEPLTERELEVLKLVAGGLSNSEIAERLFVGVGTVKKHITHIYGKLEVSSRTQALLLAQEIGLL